MAGEVKQKTQWDVEPCYIGDDVYHGMDIVTDIDDHEGNPLVVSVQTGSLTTDKQIASQVVREHNSHDDLLAACEDALSGWQYIREFHGDLPGVGWDRVEDALTAAIHKATAQESD